MKKIRFPRKLPISERYDVARQARMAQFDRRVIYGLVATLLVLLALAQVVKLL